MKLLIVTQTVNRNDPILGFFHRWVEEFAKHCEQVIVIGQRVGEYAFPQNVRVISLGKEAGAWKISQILNYRWTLFRLRREYDAILIHMTPIWAVIGWRAVFFLRKRMYLWYEARGARWPLKVSLWIVRKVFSASKSGMPVSTAKSVITGHGIDTEKFSPDAAGKTDHLAVTVGRITASKRLPIVLEAFVEMPPQFKLRIIGEPRTAADVAVVDDLRKNVSEHGLIGRVEMEPLPPEEVVMLLKRASLFLHASETSLDKALLEAMACECLIVSCSRAAEEVLPAPCSCAPLTMGSRIKELLRESPEEQRALRQELRRIVVEQHSLPRLVKRLVQEMR